MEDSLVVLDSVLNGEIVTENVPAGVNRCGILLSRTDGFLVKKVAIWNVRSGMFQIESSSENEHIKMWTQGGKQANLQQISCTDCSSGGLLKWRGGPMSNIVFDSDGSFTGKGEPTYLTPYQPFANLATPSYRHFDQAIADSKCEKQPIGKFNLPTVLCKIPLRMIQFRNYEKFTEMKGLDLRIFTLNGKTQNEFETATEDLFGNYYQYIIKEKPTKDGLESYVGVFPVGYTYNIHFLTGVDFNNLLLVNSIHALESDPPIVIRFNHS